MDQGKKTAQQLVENIYATALGEQPWEPVLHGIRDRTDSCLVSLFTLDGAGRPVMGSFSSDDPDWAESVRNLYNSEFFSCDPSAEVVRGWTTGRWFDDRVNISTAKRAHGPFHQEYLRSIGVGHWEGTFVHRTADLSHYLSLQSRSGNADESPYRVQLAEVVPHLGNAVKMQARFEELQFRAAQGDAAFDSMIAPVFLLDEDRRLLRMNAAAQLLVAEEPFLRFVHGRFEPLNVDQQSWRKHCDRGVFVVDRRLSKGRPLVLSLVPVPARTQVARDWQRPLTLMVAPSPRSDSERERLLRAIYGLTQAEAEICTMICVNGLTPNACSDARRVTIGTVRSQIKSIHIKTDVARLPDLVRLVASL